MLWASGILQLKSELNFRKTIKKINLNNVPHLLRRKHHSNQNSAHVFYLEGLLTTHVKPCTHHFISKMSYLFVLRNSSRQSRVLPAEDSVPTGIGGLVGSCMVKPFAT